MRCVPFGFFVRCDVFSRVCTFVLSIINLIRLPLHCRQIHGPSIAGLVHKHQQQSVDISALLVALLASSPRAR